MAKLTTKDVAHIATLANLQLTTNEKEKYQKQLSKVVEFIGELDEVDTSNLEPTGQTTGLENVYRVDEVNPKETLTKEEVLSGTDNTYHGYFSVKAILNKTKK